MNQREVNSGTFRHTMTCRTQRKGYLRSALLVLGAATLGCGRPDASASGAAGDSEAISVLRVPTNVHRKLVENSVAVTSVSQPGIIFGLNDSGNEPLVFAYDSTGRARGVWAISGATNRDWEAAAIGPCADGVGEPSCLFIGDVGDNDARKASVTIYRITEPVARGSIADSQYVVRITDRLDFRYEDHPHDVEAMYVTRDGSVFLITKRRLLDRQRRPRPALIYRISASAWDSSGIVTARLVDSLPIVPGGSQGSQVTDAALSPDGRLLAVRTDARVFVFAVDSVTGLPIDHTAPGSCAIDRLRERQGEGVGWWWDRRRLLLTSEGGKAPFYVVECPLPNT